MTTMSPERPTQVTIYDFIGVLFRRKWIVIIFICGVLAPIIIHNQITQPIYEAETSIVFEETKEPIPTFDFSQVIYQKSFITNQIEEIKSRTLSEDVTDELPQFVIESFKVPNPIPHGLTKKRYISPIIRKSITAEPIRDADIIKIKVQHHSPTSAAIIANMVTYVLKERRLEVKREEVSGVRNFIESQLEVVREQLLDAESALKDFKEKSRVTYLDQESQEILRRMTEVEVLYIKAKADREEIEHRLNYVQEKLAEQRRDIVPSITDVTNPWAQKLKEQLVDLEVQLTSMQVQGYPEDNPQMLKLIEQIEQTKQSLTREMLKIAEGENIIEPLSQIKQFLEESVRLGVDLHAYRSREDALRRIVNDYDKRLLTLPEKELQLAQLTRAKDVNNRIYMMLLERGEEARITEAGKISNLRVIDPAEIPMKPIKPRKRLNLILGLMVGFVVGIGIAFFTESLDTSLKTIEDVETATSLPILGSVPTIKRRKRKKVEDDSSSVTMNLLTNVSSRSSAAESYRSLHTSIQFASPDKPLKTIVVTSAGPREGKTLTVANLGITTAQYGAKTLILDADLRRPMQHRLFGKPKEPGLTNMLTDSIELDSVIHETNVDKLWILTCGILPPNPAELLSSQRMKKLLKDLREKFDIIIIDSPPAIAVTDSVVLGAEVDGVALVIQSGRATRDAVIRAVTLLENVNAKVIGAVLNDVHVESLYGRYGRYGYYYHYYHYYYTSDGEKKRKHRKSHKGAEIH